MKRHIPGLHLRANDSEQRLEGLFLVRVEWASYRWHAQKPFWLIRFVVLEPKPCAGRSFTGRLYCTERALWKLNWFLRDFGYDTDLLGNCIRSIALWHMSNSNHRFFSCANKLRSRDRDL